VTEKNITTTMTIISVHTYISFFFIIIYDPYKEWLGLQWTSEREKRIHDPDLGKDETKPQVAGQDKFHVTTHTQYKCVTDVS